MKLTASCDCGKLKLHVARPPVVQLTCHCRHCQEFSGRDFVEAGFFRKEDCQIIGDSNSVVIQGGSGLSKKHNSCASCSTPLYVQVEALNGAIAIMAGRISPFTFESEVHIWTGEKAAGTAIPLNAPQVLGAPPEGVVKRMIEGFWKQ